MDNYRSDVYSYEIDASFSMRIISNTYAILFGAARRGPTEPKFLTTIDDAIALYGKPDASVSKWLYDAMSFFEEGSGAWMTRVAPTDAQFGGKLVQNFNAGGTRIMSVTDMTTYEPDDVDLTSAGSATSLDDNLFYIHAYGQGSWSSRLRIQISSNNIVAPTINSTTSLAAIPVAGRTSILPAGQHSYIVTAYNTSGETVGSAAFSITSTAGQAVYLQLTSQIAGAMGYRVYRQSLSETTHSLIGTVAYGENEYDDLGRTTADTTIHPPVVSTVALQDWFTLSVFDESVSSVAPAETYECSFQQRTNANGDQTELEMAINSRSKLIRVRSNGRYLSSSPIVYPMAPFYLSAGSSGSAITDSDIILALKQFEDRDAFPASMVLDSSYTMVTVQKAVVALAEKRKYTIALLNVPAGEQQAQDAINYRSLKLAVSSNRAALFCNDHLIKDPYNDIQLYVSPAGKAAARLAYTDRVTNSSYSPAGFRRGVSMTTLSLRHRYKPAEKNQLAYANINYFSPERNVGAVLREAYTLQAQYSSLSYISVRRIIDIAEEQAEKALQNYLHEPNNDITAMQIASMLRDFYQLMQDNQMISGFEVSTATSAADIQNGNRRVYSLIIPMLPTIRIMHTTVISKQGADFSEVLEQVVAG